MIREAINDSKVLVGRKIRVFAQGSYRNNTNVRQGSDLPPENWSSFWGSGPVEICPLKEELPHLAAVGERDTDSVEHSGSIQIPNGPGGDAQNGGG